MNTIINTTSFDEQLQDAWNIWGAIENVEGREQEPSKFARAFASFHLLASASARTNGRTSHATLNIVRYVVHIEKMMCPVLARCIRREMKEQGMASPMTIEREFAEQAVSYGLIDTESVLTLEEFTITLNALMQKEACK